MTRKQTGPRWIGYAWRFCQIATVTLFPAALMSRLWLEVWQGVRSRATDGSGHYAIARIYDQTIFPDVFGWTHAYFAGMPFPNFYPPLFHWCVGLLHNAHVVSFPTAFKLVVTLPLLLLPAAVWLLAWILSDKNFQLAMAAACSSILPLVVGRFHVTTTGLDYSSTLVAGFYTQPLGFILLIGWYVFYLGAHRARWRLAISSLLLALTILANFFIAVTAAMLVGATAITDLVRVCRAGRRGRSVEDRSALVGHLAAPLIALCLASFWLAPMFNEYNYFATRPLILPLLKLITPALWAWYAFSAAGMLIWFRRPTRAMWPYCATLIALAGGIVLASTIAPRWFPLQAFRFFSTLNFLLAVPVGMSISALFQILRIHFKAPRGVAHFSRSVIIMGSVIVLVGVIGLWLPSTHRAFYSIDENERIEAVLRFAKEHRNGRYLVEVPDLSKDPGIHPDSPALNAYLGAQGNETLSVVYREASPNAIFFNALVNAFSDGCDSFGISSVLADDLDFAEEPLARHLEQARFVGVRYLVVASSKMKDRLAQEPAVQSRYDFGRWSVFELEDPPPLVRSLAFRPALVVSDFSLKERRRNEYDFIRLTEEQFADGWFDVLLVRSAESRIDHLRNLDQFGSLILDTYQCEDEVRAFEQLRVFARHHTLILLSSDAPLFWRIRAAISDFTLAEVVERPIEPPGEPVEAFEPSFRYGSSSIRRVWKAIRQIIDQRKISIASEAVALSSKSDQNSIRIQPDVSMPEDSASPVLISTTYFPNWRRTDGAEVYAATPFFMLTFIRGPVQISFGRYWVDKVGLGISAITLILLLGYAGYRHSRIFNVQFRIPKKAPVQNIWESPG